jgi:hypothetical protein
MIDANKTVNSKPVVKPASTRARRVWLSELHSIIHLLNGLNDGKPSIGSIFRLPRAGAAALRAAAQDWRVAFLYGARQLQIVAVFSSWVGSRAGCRYRYAFCIVNRSWARRKIEPTRRTAALAGVDDDMVIDRKKHGVIGARVQIAVAA